MSNKLRPANGPGSNGLRGGIKDFSPKTMTGPWLEEYGGTSFYKRGFTTVDYETEAQHQQLGATLKPAPFYGAGLPNDEVRNKPKSPFQYEANPSADSWSTNTQMMTRSILNRNREEEESTTIKPRLAPAQLEEYRKTWTTDMNDKARLMRFTTETRLAAGRAVGEKFAIRPVRFLPGTPKPYELCREKLVERFGIFAFAAAKKALGSGAVTAVEFRQNIRDLKLDLKPYEVNQMIAYITPSATSVPVDKFIDAIKGNVSGFERNQAESIFRKIAAQGDSSVSLSAVLQAVNTDDYPELVDGFNLYAVAYSPNGEDLSSEDFIQLLNDMFIASSALYQQASGSMWRV